MIFEDAQPLTRELMMERKNKSKENWIEIGVDYLDKKASGWTQIKYSRETGIPVSTLQKALYRYKTDINNAYEILGNTPVAKRKPTKLQQKKDIINAFRAQIKKSSNSPTHNKSTKWFEDTLKKRVKNKAVINPKPGAIYTFVYDAKHKNTLPYWDKFPLIIFLGMQASTKSKSIMMQGLNLHYITPRQRQSFLEELLIYMTTKTLNSNTKLKIKWSNVKHMRGSTEMIKNYLPGNIKGKLIEINPTDWASVIFLPTQKFISNGRNFNSKAVWSKV